MAPQRNSVKSIRVGTCNRNSIPRVGLSVSTVNSHEQSYYRNERAKALGGCQIHNAMVYVRGGKQGYDEWAEHGCKGWEYDSLIPYFEKVEQQVHILHGKQNQFSQALIKSCEEFGIPYNEDYNKAGSEFGISPFQFLIDDQMKRETAFHAYYNQVANLSNISIRTNVQVNRVLLDEDKRCVGVEFFDTEAENQTTKVQVKTNKEVILSAGAIGTPQILMLSGIGPKSQLEKFKIPIISDLPGVGENFQDDLFVTAAFLSKKRVYPQPYGLLGTVIFWPSNMSRNTDENDIDDDTQIPTNIEASLASGEMIGLQLPKNLQQSYWIYPNIQRLNSRGTVKLQSKNIFDHPLIDPNYLDDPRDVARCVKALKLAIKIGSSDAMVDWFDSQLYPPAALSDQQLKQYVLSFADTTYHYAGTAKMGPKSDEMAVAAPETLEVYGVEGLRVVDASIIPTTVSGNTQGAAMMIAEKASAMILNQDYPC
eukprot:TRINITY_DN8396_c0_g2_i10.p1 TRINITY_DN8396_c0_g2~~TRINITY_DN8396_c0_g2_i10.p1  ORF type:complete len:481 (-),score=56.52 TRINITY_DN8396_c0_g2_i10:637-2079(-)